MKEEIYVGLGIEAGRYANKPIDSSKDHPRWFVQRVPSLAINRNELINDDQLMFSVFKTLTDQTVVVELKNDLCITGVLKSVDQYVLFGILLSSHCL